LAEKKEILEKVVRSPQFIQSLGSLTVALRDGGLPSISEALGVKVKNGGYTRHGGMPLGGGEAVEAFLEGVKKGIQDEDDGDENRMDTD
jgi:26S proteasome regulatory subunit N13